MKIEEAMNVIQKDSADNLRIMLALNTIFDAIRSGDYVLIRKQEVYSLEARFQRLEDLMMFREGERNEETYEKTNKLRVGDEIIAPHLIKSDELSFRGVIVHIAKDRVLCLTSNGFSDSSIDFIQKTGKYYPEIVRILDALGGTE